MEREIDPVSVDICAVLRKRLTKSQILQATHLLDYLRDLDPDLADLPGEQLAARVAHLVEEAIEHHLGRYEDLREAAKIMAGVSPKTRRSSMTRQQIRDAERAALPRRRQGTSGVLSGRQVENIERFEIAPAVKDALARCIRAQRPHPTKWRACRIDYRLYGGAPGELLLRWALEYRSMQDAVIVAVTANGRVADGLCVQFPEVTEVLVPSDNLEHESRVHVEVHDIDGEWRSIPVAQAVPSDLSAELVRESGDLQIDDFLVARLPGESGSERRVRMTSTQVITLVEGFCYWTAPRQVELHDIVVDYSGFPNAEAFDFSLRPRMGVPTTVNERPDARDCSLRVDTWVTHGSGFHFEWRAKRP